MCLISVNNSFLYPDITLGILSIVNFILPGSILSDENPTKISFPILNFFSSGLNNSLVVPG